MLSYSLENTGNKSLYVYIYECIKKDILSGSIKSGEKLPSKRAFAENLGVSVITVENAYGLLQSEGYIYSIEKRGYFAADISPLYTEGESKPVKRVSPKKKKKYKYDFVNNSTRAENFPFSVWTKLMRKTFSQKQSEIMEVSPCSGIFELREALCRHLKQFRGMDITPERVIVGAGTEYLYGMIIKLLGHDKIYAVENPGYPKIAKIYEKEKVKLVAAEQDSHGISVDSLLNSQADVAHISPSHHFPTGKTTSIKRRTELLNLANEKENRYIIEDEYDSEFRLTGKPLPTMQSIDRHGKVIYVNTFTKSLAPTVRISYMVLPPGLAEKFYGELGFYSCTVSNFEQYALASFINEGYFEKHINRMRLYYRKVRDEMLKAIDEQNADGLVCVSEHEAGLHFLMKINTALPDSEIKRRAEKMGIKISFLSEYYIKKVDASVEHTLVVNYSGIKKEEIKPAVKALFECIRNKF